MSRRPVLPPDAKQEATLYSTDFIGRVANDAFAFFTIGHRSEAVLDDVDNKVKLPLGTEVLTSFFRKGRNCFSRLASRILFSHRFRKEGLTFNSMGEMEIRNKRSLMD